MQRQVFKEFSIRQLVGLILPQHAVTSKKVPEAKIYTKQPKVNKKNSNFAFLIAGATAGSPDHECRTYNTTTAEWIQNPKPTATSNQVDEGCTLFNSLKHDNRPVVIVVGGKDIKTEIWDYTVAGAIWETCKYKEYSFGHVPILS